MKNPWFKFYASDFYMDTITWDAEMVGLHIRLMCQQWINNGIQADGEYPMGMDEKQQQIFDKIRHKYSIKKSGKFFNKRLKKTQKEKSEFLKKARNAGHKGASRRWNKDRVPYSEPHKNPNGVSMTSHSQIHSQITTVVVAEKEQPFFEMFKRASGHHFTDQVLVEETRKFMNKYPAAKGRGAASIVNRWVDNMQTEAALKSSNGIIKNSSFT